MGRHKTTGVCGVGLRVVGCPEALPKVLRLRLDVGVPRIAVGVCGCGVGYNAAKVVPRGGCAAPPRSACPASSRLGFRFGGKLAASRDFFSVRKPFSVPKRRNQDVDLPCPTTSKGPAGNDHRVWMPRDGHWQQSLPATTIGGFARRGELGLSRATSPKAAMQHQY